MTADLAVVMWADVTMKATGPLTHRCPFVKEVDNGTITITWETRGATLELHALRRYLDTFQCVEISHEDLTERIRADLAELPGIINLRVETTWETAGMEVNCGTS